MHILNCKYHLGLSRIPPSSVHSRSTAGYHCSNYTFSDSGCSPPEAPAIKSRTVPTINSSRHIDSWLPLFSFSDSRMPNAEFTRPEPRARASIGSGPRARSAGGGSRGTNSWMTYLLL